MRPVAARDVLPSGLIYREGFITVDQHDDLLGQLGSLEFHPVTMRGRASRRTVRHFGLRYDYGRRGLVTTDPLPGGIAWLRDRCAALLEIEPADLAQILISRYPPGAGIGWHRDAPMFGDRIAGVSVLGASRMRFQREIDGERRTAALELAPRSAYVLGGDARWSWQHSIAPTKELRYSLTFRTVA
jgi:alkylated DNA repair protein (DNA oxidative demethylase)